MPRAVLPMAPGSTASTRQRRRRSRRRCTNWPQATVRTGRVAARARSSGKSTFDTVAGKAILRDLVNATVGFEELAAEIKKPSKSLHRMLAPHGNPSTENFFGIVNALQKKTRVRLHVTAKAG